MRIKTTSLSLLLIVILFGGIFISSAFGVWQTESSKVPVKFSEGEFEGQYDPADIRGSYTFNDVSTSFNIPSDILKKAFGIPDEVDPSVFKNKDLENIYGSLEDGLEIGNASVKLFVALYAELPYDMDEDTYLPKSAVEILKANASLTEEQIKYLDSHTIDIDSLDQEAEETNAASNSEGINEDHYSDDYVVRGKTTFKEVLDWGVSKEVIEGIIDGDIPNTGMTVRDYCTNRGLQFSVIKGNLQNEIDKLNE